MINRIYLAIWLIATVLLLSNIFFVFYIFIEEYKNGKSSEDLYKKVLKKTRPRLGTIIIFVVTALLILLSYGISAKIRCKINPNETITYYYGDPINFATFENNHENGVHFKISDVGVLYDEETGISFNRNVQMLSINLVWLIYLIGVLGSFINFFVVCRIFTTKEEALKNLSDEKYDKCLLIHSQLTWLTFFFGCLGCLKLQLLFNYFAEWLINLK